MPRPTSGAESLLIPGRTRDRGRETDMKRPADQRRARLPGQPDPRGLAPHPQPPQPSPPAPGGGVPLRRPRRRQRQLDRLTAWPDRSAHRRETRGPLSPVPDMMGCMTVTTAPLVGRDAELEDLTLRLGIVASGDARSARPGGGIVLLAGDAGVGKTRLLTALRDRALDLGWQVVAGHCLDFADSALPYLPFSEILGRLQASVPEVVSAVAAHHPALHRLSPGRRMIDEAGEGRHHHRQDRAVRSRARPLRGRRRAAAARGRRRGPPLGRPVDPRPDELPVHPPVQPAGGPRGVLPLRRPPPQAPPPRQGRRLVAAPDRAPHVPRAARRRRGPRAGRLPRRRPGRRADRRRGRHGRRARRGQRVLRRGARRRHRRQPRTAACPPTSPRCCWSGSTGSTSPRARSFGRRASPGAGSPTSCSPSRPTSTTRRSTRACAPPSSATSWSPATATTPSVTPCSARPSTTTCCPASECGSMAATPPPSATAAPAAPPPSWPATPSSPTTTRPPSRPASRPVTRPPRSAVPTRPPNTSSGRCGCSPGSASPARRWSTGPGSRSTRPRP